MGALNVLDLFSGIGGFSLGLERAGMRTVAFCEIDPFCRRVLRKHWPGVPIYEDVRELTAERLLADGISVDLISGGFPCQDISAAGRGAGIEGSRSSLWKEYARLIGELRPRVAVVENTAALTFRGLLRILGDLAEIGYDAEWHCIPASAVGAPHRRERVWIIAYPNDVDGETRLGPFLDGAAALLEASDRNRSQNGCPLWMEAASGFPGGLDGFSDFVDRRKRTEALGNAVVPQIPEIIGKAIMRAQ